MNLRTNTAREWIANIVFALCVLIGIAIAVVMIRQSVQTSRDNNVYVRYIACVTSIPTYDRTPKLIETCWNHVIEEARHEVHRYDKVEDEHHWLDLQ